MYSLRASSFRKNETGVLLVGIGKVGKRYCSIEDSASKSLKMVKWRREGLGWDVSIGSVKGQGSGRGTVMGM